jgi:lipopolysaccharide export LptBFGC system permease protein LptF
VEETKSMARAALHGVVLLFVFYLAREYGATLASRGVTPTAATPWLVLASFGAFGAWRFARIAR